MQPHHRFTATSPRIHYLEWPSPARIAGTPVLLVHGLLTHARAFADVAEQISHGSLRSAPRRVVALDLRGRGDSESPAHGYTIADHAADIAAVVHAASFPPHFLVASFSVGAVYAMAYARHNPGRIGALVVGDFAPRTAHVPPDTAEQALLQPTEFRSWEAARDHLASVRTLDDAQWEQMRFSLFRDLPDGRVGRWYSRTAYEGLLRESEDTDLWDTVGSLGAPVTVLRGTERGSALREEQAQEYRRLGARVAPVPGAGHDVYWSNPAACVSEINDLLFWLDATE